MIYKSVAGVFNAEGVRQFQPRVTTLGRPIHY
ncbi:MAG: hypothetical protein JWM21_4244 [Acidobacteria bacterium]|nr:hypothetical protein [Acidobacteriota bacterium]